MEKRNKMAVIVGDDGNISAAGAGTEVVKYTKVGGTWREDSRMPYGIDLGKGLLAARDDLAAVCRELDDCKAVIGASVAGIPYQMFDKAGLSILEVKSFSADDLPLLEGLLTSGQPIEETIEGPISTGNDGNFTFDMNEAQRKHPDRSSKMLLKDFLDNVPFYTLEVICKHVPPWIESMAPSAGFLLSSKTDAEGSVVLTIGRGCNACNPGKRS
jgi:hypothetical protein